MCTDHKGRNISHGDPYFPLGSDLCTQCTCNNGTHGMCIAVYCSPPEKCRQYQKLNDKCCDFVCLDLPGVNTTKETDPLTPTNLGLRLVASAVTSFLILALLLFMIHRLRQRRLLLVIRRLNAHRLDSVSHGGQNYSNDDEGNVGYFVGHDHLDFGSYDEPPPPYSFWKPPENYVPTGEAPPPYEVTIRYPPPTISVSPTIGAQQGRLFPRPDHATDSRSPSTGVGTQVLLGLSLGGDRRSSSDGRTSCRSSQISPGVFSANDQGESTCSSDINYARGPVLESDARYEDAPFSRNTTSCLHSNGTSQSTPYDLCEDDIVNGNVLVNTPGVESSSTSSSLGRTGRSSSSKSQDSRTGNRCHSYCEGLGQWRAEQTSQKQTLMGGSNNNIIQDPTAWVGDTSETSTSTSPSSEQQTVSPSSSDTSGDGEYLQSNPKCPQSSYSEKSERTKQKLLNHSASGSNNVGVEAKGGTSKKTQITVGGTREKRNSLERTLKQLRRFSLPSKKKANEPSTSYAKATSSSVGSSRLSYQGRNERGGNRNSAASISESSCSTSASPEALDENRTKLIPEEPSGKFQQSKCKHVWHRPASLNLNSYYIANPRANANLKASRTGSDPSSKCSTDSSADSAPPNGISLPTARNYFQRSITPRDSTFSPPYQGSDSGTSRPMANFHLMENLPQIVTPDNTLSPESALVQSQRRAAIARSSSICSETGERNPRRLSLNVVRSHTRQGSDSTPENGLNSYSPSTGGGENSCLDNLRPPPNKFGRSCSSESNNSSTGT